MHSSCMLREGARPEIVRGNLGHANVVVTQNSQQPKRDLNTPRNPALQL